MNIYSDDNFTSSDNKKPLWEDIRKFSKSKYFIAIALIIIASLGFVIPIIPGIIFIVLAIALFKKGWMSKIRTRFRLWKMK
jgi:preprotein translocase subunit Sss1